MTSTPRLDSITADGTNHDRIRLADGTALALTIRPGAEYADEVFLYPGLTAPVTEAWENEDPWEEWLTGGSLGGGAFAGVPVQAIRELIEEHGGEHEDQESEIPTPGEEESDEESAPEDLLTQLADLHGRFGEGYGAEDVRSVFGRIYDAGGPYLVCVWDHADEAGFGGNSQFYAENEEGEFFEVKPDVYWWLSGDKETPGPVDTWVCSSAKPLDVPVSDDFHNYARSSEEGETAETLVKGALAAWGITAHLDVESLIGGYRNTRLVIGYDQTRQGFPHLLGASYIVLYLYRCTDADGEEITVERAPGSGYDWHVRVGDGTGAERELMTTPAEQLTERVEAIADWVTTPPDDHDDAGVDDHEAAHAGCIEPHRSADGYVDCDGKAL